MRCSPLSAKTSRPRSPTMANATPSRSATRLHRAHAPAVRLAPSCTSAPTCGPRPHPARARCCLSATTPGGTLIADTFVFGQHFYDHFGPERRFHQLAHDLVFKVPGLRALLDATAPFPPRRRTWLAGAARRRGAACLPGGDHETYRPSGNRIGSTSPGAPASSTRLKHRVPWSRWSRSAARRRRSSSARAAVRARARARPAVASEGVARSDRATIRADGADLPGRIPLPAKISIRVLKPIDLRDRLGSRPDPEDGYKLVTSTMQRTLTRLSSERSLPVVG